MIGTMVSYYQILSKLGEGGMGVVYLAHDVKLGRDVALKFLPHGLQPDESERARFMQEAHAAAILNHPHICTVYDIQEHDGQQFIVMEYIEGKSLRALAPVKDVQDAVTFAIQIGEALQEAHCHGVVHRDIKADNIMVNAKNQVKIMDFGLAKLKGSLKLTRTLSTLGTLAYMAPEQLRGEEADARSDIFSFGVVLFEMLAGRLPFGGDHEAAMMYSIVNEPPKPLQKYRPDVPPELEQTIGRALEKERGERYQHVDDMVSELRRVPMLGARVSHFPMPETGPAEPSSVSAPPGQEGFTPAKSETKHPSRLVWSALIGTLVILGFLGYLVLVPGHKTIDSIAVLPFVNASGDPNTEYLSDGITETLINGLSRLSNLAVMSRSSVFHYKGKDTDPQAIGKELGVEAVLTGRVMQRGENLVISTELVDVSNNHHIWGDQYNRKFADILPVQEEIAREISRNLRLHLGSEEERRLSQRSTESTEAYQLYLKGRFHWNKRKADDLQKALEYFDQARIIDPSYALAYAGLASTYCLLPEYAAIPPREAVPKAEAAALKAAELDPTLAEPHAVLGLLKQTFRWDWEGAQSEYKRAIELNPNYPTSYHWYSECLKLQGKFDQGLIQIKRAQELDPLSPVISLNVAEMLDAMRQDDLALEQYRKTLELDPNLPGAHEDLGLLLARQGKVAEAISEFQTMRQIVGPDNLYGLGSLGIVLGEAGKKEEARDILRKLLAASKQGSSKSTQIAGVYAALDDKEKAIQWLERAYEEGDAVLCYLKIDPVWDGLRPDVRFTALLKKIGLGS